jgi:hypothetical protein
MGYGVLYRSKSWLAHRYCYTEIIGPIPKGKILMHTCDIPLCVNPEHLRLGTMKDNTYDMISKKRDKNSRKTHCKNGHEFNEENTKIRIRNNKQHRQCKTCIKEWSKNQCLTR